MEVRRMARMDGEDDPNQSSSERRDEEPRLGVREWAGALVGWGRAAV